MWNDPIVEETRKIRDEIAARFNYDVEALGRYYQSQQVKEQRVFVRRPAKKVKQGQSAQGEDPSGENVFTRK
jgi:hypothetical protein